MKKTIRDYDLENKKVIIRVDFNVPLKNNRIVDDTRIVSALDTIKYALSNNAKVILLSHMGRIKEESDKEKNNLEIVAKRLSKLLDKDVLFISSLDYEEIKNKIDTLSNGDICLLQNTRFYDLENKKESGNSNELASMYASLGDIFINDAFATIHRAHASNVGIASLLPNGIGFLVEKELNNLSYLDNAEKPYVVILGGSKVSDKIGVIENLINKCNYLIIGGAMAFTFLKAKGYNIGKSLVELDRIDFCKDILSKYGDKIILPIDVVVSDSIDSNITDNRKIENIKDSDMGLDIGIETINKMKEILSNTKTVFWNGPLGYYENDLYKNGTKQVLEYLVSNNIKTILGGGDIVAASNSLGLKDKVYYASTGGGATLEYLEGKSLPGLEIIQNKE